MRASPISYNAEMAPQKSVAAGGAGAPIAVLSGGMQNTSEGGSWTAPYSGKFKFVLVGGGQASNVCVGGQAADYVVKTLALAKGAIITYQCGLGGRSGGQHGGNTSITTPAGLNVVASGSSGGASSNYDALYTGGIGGTGGTSSIPTNGADGAGPYGLKGGIAGGGSGGGAGGGGVANYELPWLTGGGGKGGPNVAGSWGTQGAFGCGGGGSDYYYGNLSQGGPGIIAILAA